MSDVHCLSVLEDGSIQETIYYADGTRDVIIVRIEAPISSRGSITASKTRNYYSSNDDLLWQVKLTGSFTYNGTSASCTGAATTVTIYNASWSAVTENTTHRDNTASNSVIMGKEILGIVVPSIHVNLTLSCDKNGNLS